jgi:hypothetical protein
METDIFKKLDKKHYSIWSDCGKQFRSKEFYYFLFSELGDNEIEEKRKFISLNFFAEKHGRCF